MTPVGIYKAAIRPLFPVIAACAAALSAAPPSVVKGTYAVVLRDSGTKHANRSAQGSVRSALAGRGLAASGSTDTLLNALFVSMTPAEAAEIRNVKGVSYVAPLPVVRRAMQSTAVTGRGDWSLSAVSGATGAGVRIAVLDTGIDATHPAFQDSSLSLPMGFPKVGKAEDREYTSNKVIAARSFVSQIAGGVPDDASARDRVGHGTAVAAIAAGVAHEAPLGTVAGVAPKAWLGNYKIFGSPGVNDTTTADVVLQALEAAYLDGMDVAVISIGSMPAAWSAADTGATCQQPTGVPCDAWAAAVSNAIRGGMTVVLPAGNDGLLGGTTINTPGTVPAAITVGASTSAHLPRPTVTTAMGASFAMQPGDGPQLTTALTAPLIPVSRFDATEHACMPLPDGSMTGAVALVGSGALIGRGDCSFATKVHNVKAAGAVAALIFRDAGAPEIAGFAGLRNTGIPAALLSTTSGKALKSWCAANREGRVTLTPAPADLALVRDDAVATFSSRGPNVGDAGIKPEFVAPGTGIYTATQSLDANGDLYNPTRYVGVEGTSFSAAYTAGAAALVRQQRSSWTPVQIKSALTNTATDLQESVLAAGAGKLNLDAAVTATITVDPAAVSFGGAGTGLASRTLALTNSGTSAVTLNLQDSRGSLSISPASVSLAPGQTGRVTVALAGASPGSGIYEGFIRVTGSPTPLRVPYTYLVSDGVPARLLPLAGRDFTAEGGSIINVSFRVVDRFGIPVSGVPVRFAPPASVHAAVTQTDVTGVAEALMTVPRAAGEQRLWAELLSGENIEWKGRTRLAPQIADAGVTNAGSFEKLSGFAPGSYVALFGAGLSETPRVADSATLPLSLAGVSASFTSASGDVTIPARIHSVSNGQVNVQVPWEVAGWSSATVRLAITDSATVSVRRDDPAVPVSRTQAITLPIATTAPGWFEYSSGSDGLLAAALDEEARVIGFGNPGRRGRVIQLFANGLGQVAAGTQPRTGEATSVTGPLAYTTAAPAVTIDGQPAQVLFSGLCPGSIGLYQVNVRIPDEAASGKRELSLSLDGAPAKSSAIVIE